MPNDQMSTGESSSESGETCNLIIPSVVRYIRITLRTITRCIVFTAEITVEILHFNVLSMYVRLFSAS